MRDIWPINHIPSIGERLRTQNNQCTAEPAFCVMEKWREYGYDPQWSDSLVWLLTDGATEEVPEGTEGAILTGYKDMEKCVMTAFTEAGALDYIRKNGHNHRGKLSIYVDSFRRCEEMIAVRAFLMSLP